MMQKLVQLIIHALLCLFFLRNLIVQASSDIHYYDFVLKETNVTKLCVGREILTVNGSFPGPEIRAHKGDTVYVNVYNQGYYGVTLHWHGVKNPGNSWADGPEYITQCGIEPGSNFTYEVILSDEEGTVWWHAHSDWTRATVHGAIVILPKEGSTFPFSEPDGEEIVVLGDWYKEDLKETVDYDMETGTDVPHTSGYTINGELGHFSNCSTNETIHYWTVDYGKTYLLRIINAVLDDEVFFAIAEHELTVVGMDGAYVKPFMTSYIMISPGNTVDVLVTTNQTANDAYYMAVRQYSTENQILTYEVGTAILQYNANASLATSPIFPTETLPANHAFEAAVNYTSQLRSFGSHDLVPTEVDTRMYIVVSVNNLPCPALVNCTVSNSTSVLAASMNNISWWTMKIMVRFSGFHGENELDKPICVENMIRMLRVNDYNRWTDTSTSILQAYYRNITGVYSTDFPDWPTVFYNFTGDAEKATITGQGTKVKVLEYNETVEIVFQGTNVLDGSGNHPMHLHGYSFYVVGSGTGNFDSQTDPNSYNLVDPPKVNTFSVPKLGWLTIRFKATNPGVWYWHCHLDRHMIRGMNTVLIVKDGGTKETSLRPPPPNMPSCTTNSTDILCLRPF